MVEQPPDHRLGVGGWCFPGEEDPIAPAPVDGDMDAPGAGGPMQTDLDRIRPTRGLGPFPEPGLVAVDNHIAGNKS